VTVTERLAALEARIEFLEAKEAIAEQIARYTEAIRLGRPQEVLELMTEDAVVELRHADPGNPVESELVARFVGHDEIRFSFAGEAGPGASVWPMIHNLRVDLEGNRAHTICVLESAVWPVGKQFVGEYRDTWVRVNGTWKFATRSHIGFGDTSGIFSREAYVAYQSTKAEAAQT